MVEEGDDSLDEEGGRGEDIGGRAEDDSDDQFADDEAASNQGDSSSQEYLEDHYAGQCLQTSNQMVHSLHTETIKIICPYSYTQI